MFISIEKGTAIRAKLFERGRTSDSFYKWRMFISIEKGTAIELLP